MGAIQRTNLALAPDGVVGTLFAPPATDPIPGIVLVGGSDGAAPDFAAERLAREGFATLSLVYFKRDGLPAHLREVPLEYFERALGAIRRPPAVRVGPVAIMGFSRGSEAALLSGVYFPGAVNAVVGVVPGNVALCSWPPGGPAWTLKGAPLPYVTRFGPLAADPDAEIPVERIRGPVLLISAGADRVWPSSAMAAAMASRLKAKGHPYPDEFVNFPLAGHMLDQRGAAATPTGGLGASPAVEQAASAREVALAEVCRFLRRLR